MSWLSLISYNRYAAGLWLIQMIKTDQNVICKYIHDASSESRMHLLRISLIAVADAGLGRSRLWLCLIFRALKHMEACWWNVSASFLVLALPLPSGSKCKSTVTDEENKCRLLFWGEKMKQRHSQQTRTRMFVFLYIFWRIYVISL